MSLKKLALIGALALTAGLSACATATPYQPKITSGATTGGFSDQRLEGDRYRVAFAGNSLTSRETVERYLLYRAAELTVQQGYDWFETADRRTDRTSRTVVDTDPLARPGFGYGYDYGFWRPSWRYFGPRLGWRSWDPFGRDPFWPERMETRTIEKFEASAEILLLKTPKDAADPASFDARQVVANLAPKVTKPAP